MTDIEKKAREYADEVLKQALLMYDKDASEFLAENAYHAYLQGMKDALSNQWRDAEKEKPERGKAVFIGYFGDNHEDYFDIAYQDKYGTWYSEISEHGYPLDCPTHWLPIPEYEPKGE